MVVTKLRIERLEPQPAAPPQDEATIETEPLRLPATLRRGVVADEILIGSLGDARLRVQSPIKVKFAAENQDFIAEALDFDEFGFGDTRSAALRDLQRAIVELYFTLKTEKDSLGADLLRLWSRLQSVIRER